MKRIIIAIAALLFAIFKFGYDLKVKDLDLHAGPQKRSEPNSFRPELELWNFILTGYRSSKNYQNITFSNFQIN